MLDFFLLVSYKVSGCFLINPYSAKIPYVHLGIFSGSILHLLGVYSKISCCIPFSLSFISKNLFEVFSWLLDV